MRFGVSVMAPYVETPILKQTRRARQAIIEGGRTLNTRAAAKTGF
jgi:hypothetical protein